MIRLPIFKLFVPFLLGILLQHFFPGVSGIKLLLCFGILSVVIVLFISVPSVRLCIFLLFVLLGMLRWEWHSRDLKISPVKITSEWSSKTARIEEKMRSGGKYHRYLAKCFANDSSYTVLLYTPDAELYTGQLISFHAPLHQIKPPTNFALFNFADYMAQKKVYLQAYIKPEMTVKGKAPQVPAARLEQWKHTVTETLSSRGYSENQLGLLFGLAFGEHALLSPEALTNFRDVGLMHIMAVSGLHVGIIYMLLTFLLSGFGRWFPMSKSTIMWITFIFLGAYVLFVGATPSVVRAVVMIFIVEFQRVYLKRFGSAYGSVLLSAFVLLLVAPKWIFDVGFQLSYTAVIFIVWLYPLLIKKLKSRNIILNYLGKTTSISLAAQCGVLSLSMFYFHQFSFLFYLGNVLFSFSVPLLVVGALITSFTATLPFFEFISWGFGYFLDGFLTSVHVLSGLKTLIFKGIYLTPFMVFALLSTLTCSILFFTQRFSIRYLYFSLVSIICFGSVYLRQQIIRNNSQEVIFFSHFSKDIIAFRSGGKLVVFHPADSTLAARVVRDYALQNRIYHTSFVDRNKSFTTAHLIKTRHFLSFYGGVILTPESQIQTVLPPDLSRVPAVMIAASTAIPLHKIDLPEGMFLLSSSIPKWKASQWKKYFDKFGISFVDLKQKHYRYTHRSLFLETVFFNNYET